MTHTPEDAALVAIARAALEAAVKGETYTPKDPSIPAWSKPGGCFVTLKKDGQLRGCLGCFEAHSPLYRTVADYARFSALEDPRFAGHRLQPAELSTVELEISVLSPLEICAYPEKIQLGVHGIHVLSGAQSGCFLPQVATETGWTVEEFWGHCCQDKAGLAWDAWRRPEVQKRTFTARVLGGE